MTDSTGKCTTPTLVLCDGNTTYSLGLMVPRRGPVPYAVRGVCVFLQEVIPRTSPVDDHASNGAA